jgi:hypothetical protein
VIREEENWDKRSRAEIVGQTGKGGGLTTGAWSEVKICPSPRDRQKVVPLGVNGWRTKEDAPFSAV